MPAPLHAPARHSTRHRKLLVTVAGAAAVVITAGAVLAGFATANPKPHHRHHHHHHHHHVIPTRFGASVQAKTTPWTTAVGRSDARYGNLRMVRVFYPGLPEQWPGRAGQVHRPVAVSFDVQPSVVLSGRYDSYFKTWFRNAPKVGRTWWTYIHEPEDDIERGRFTASSYRAAWRHLYALQVQATHNHLLRPTLTLMCYTMSPYSHRNFNNYNPGNFIRTYAWDCYNRLASSGRYISPKAMFRYVLPFTRAHHKGFGVAELGSRVAKGKSAQSRARWLLQTGTYLRQQHAAYVSYFDSTVGDDYRLLDAPSQSAWRTVINY
jgi:hypothetical protein